ncbi:MAG: chromate transporter [Bacillota bacterium]|nr:chromate transporter [Bacillota bacterium]
MAYLQLFWAFFRISIFGFGGGYGILPLLYQSILEFGFMPQAEFARLVALSQVTPGPIIINAATYVGYQYAGLGGSVAATLGIVTPSVLLVLLICRFMKHFQESWAMEGILNGIRPATVGLLASAVIYLATGSLWQAGVDWQTFFTAPAAYIHWAPAAFFLVTAIVYGKWRFSPIKLTIVAGVAGAFLIR